MVNILHQVGAHGASPETVYDALTTLEGLGGWWASDTTGTADVLDEVIAFRFGPGGIDMAVRELVPGKLVRWEVVDGPEEWIGTEVAFELRAEGDWTIINFSHRGWAQEVDFMHHCSTKWATFLMSLKTLLETGTGAPDPYDVKIVDWN